MRVHEFLASCKGCGKTFTDEPPQQFIGELPLVHVWRVEYTYVPTRYRGGIFRSASPRAARTSHKYVFGPAPSVFAEDRQDKVRDIFNTWVSEQNKAADTPGVKAYRKMEQVEIRSVEFCTSLMPVLS